MVVNTLVSGILKKIMVRCLMTAFFVCLCFNLHSQPLTAEETVGSYKEAQKRLLVLSTARFINLQTQGHLDQDSVLLIACRITGLSFLTPHSDAFDNELFSIGAELINADKIPEAIRLLKDLDGVKRLQLLSELAIWYLHRPGRLKRHLDSANRFIQDALTLNFTLRDKNKSYQCLHLLAEYYRQSGDELESKNILLQIASSSQREGNKKVTARAWNYLGQLRPGIDSSTYAYLNNSLILYQQLGLKEKEVELLWEIASHHRTHNLDLWKNDLTRIAEIQQSIGYKHSLFAEYYLSDVCLQQAKNLPALEHANAAIKNMKWSGMSVMQATFYRQLGAVYRRFGKNEEALASFKKGLANRSVKTQIFWFKNVLFTATLLLQMNRPEESLSLIRDIIREFPAVTQWDKARVFSIKGVCYGKLENYKLADENFMAFFKVITEYPEIDPLNEFEEVYIEIARFYLSKRDLQAARLFVHRAISGTPPSMSNYAQKSYLLFKLDSIAGNHKSTMAGKSAWRFNDYSILYKSLSDEDENTAQRNKFDELTKKYGAGKKDNDIKSLQKEKQLRENMLRQAKYTHNWILVGVALLTIIVGLLVHHARLKHRANTKLKTQGMEIKEQNSTLRHLVDEKDWLVKEIHHRVKNNLQIVMSLLNSQTAYIDNEPALAAIHDSQHRVHAMSLIHQKLYGTDNVSSIDMPSYIRELAAYLRDSFDSGQRIHFEYNIAPLGLDVNQAVPLGLILNEAITNSMKYAFPDEQTGVVSICLSNVTSNRWLLSMSDNGVGIPVDSKKTGSLGLSLMKGLSEDLDGDFSIENNNGTMIKVSFVHDMRAKKPATLSSVIVWNK